MNILQIVNSLTHTSIPVEMACEMLKRENVVIASLYDTQKEASNFADEMGIHCKIIGFGYKKNKILALKNFVIFLRKSSYDIVHTHHSLSGSLARLICYRRNGMKLVHTVHANYHSYSKIQNLLIGSTLNRTDAIVFNSKSSCDNLYGWEKRKIKKAKKKVIYNGVNTNRIKKANDEFWKEFCENNGFKDDDYLITQIGRLEHVKNPMGALLGFVKLKNKIKKELWERLYFIFVGDGSEHANLVKFIKNNQLDNKVFLTGVINRDNVYSWMKRADLLIVPSYSEGFCNTLVEGMVAGMNVCISDLQVFEEIVPKSIEVRRFDPQNEEDIEEALQESVFLDKIKNRDNGNLLLKFSIESTIDNYLKLFNNLINH